MPANDSAIIRAYEHLPLIRQVLGRKLDYDTDGEMLTKALACVSRIVSEEALNGCEDSLRRRLISALRFVPKEIGRTKARREALAQAAAPSVAYLDRGFEQSDLREDIASVLDMLPGELRTFAEIHSHVPSLSEACREMGIPFSLGEQYREEIRMRLSSFFGLGDNVNAN